MSVTRSFQQRGNEARKKTREVRLVSVAKYYLRGYSTRKIIDAVKTELDLPSFSQKTCMNDIAYLLKEWRSQRIADVDHLVQSELEKMNQSEAELWEAWDKSKTDYTRERKKQKGVLSKNSSVTPTELEKQEENVSKFGDPRYQAELTKIRDQRIKLLGLAEPERFKVETEELDLSQLTEQERETLLSISRKKLDT